MRRGATLVGTESLALLLDEYRLLQQPGDTQTDAAALLERRDRFIAGRIADTLGDDELGILFIGALHHVDRYLPARMSVEYLAIERG
jgi:hypothetical protein